MGRRFSGWRVGLLMSSVWTGAVFILNLVLTIWATRTFGAQNGYGTLVEGECSKTRKASTWIHLAINVLSTILLSASNYCMQILTAPTRPEVDRAHAKGKWLDIGVPSVRNLKWISAKRVCVWICLALSSLPLHLLYNSAIYDTLASNSFTVWAGSQDVDSWHTGSSGLANQFIYEAQGNRLERLDLATCIQAYTPEFVSGRSHFAVVLGNSTNLTDNPKAVTFGGGAYSADWFCTNSTTTEKYYNCSSDSIIRDVDNGDNWHYNGSTIEYCLSQRVEEHCQLQFSVKIMIIVIIANFLKLVCMLYTVRSHKIPTLVTVGDAVSSFLQDQDPTTVGYCTLSKKDVDNDGKWSKCVLNGSYQAMPAQPQPWITKRQLWFSGASKTRWFICYFL